MAGNCKPSQAKAEVPIYILGTQNRDGIDANKLVNGQLDVNHYGNALLYVFLTDYIEFKVGCKCNIWAIGGRYEDSGGSTGQSVKLHKKDTLGAYVYAGSYATRDNNMWYIMIDGLLPGTYRLYMAKEYVGIQELYGETINLCLYLDDRQRVFGMQNSVFTKLNDNWTILADADKKALFLSTNYDVATASDLSTLGKFKVLTYAETDDKPTLSLTAVPHDQLVTPNKLIRIESYDGIDKATIASTISGKSACKILVTTDLTTYQTYDFATQTWQPIDHTDLAAVKASGINAVALQTIDRTAWDLLTTGKSGIGFAYFLSIDSTSDTCAVDKLTLQVDMRGSWDKAVHGTDYGYGYPYNTTLRIDIKKNGDYKINYCGGV